MGNRIETADTQPYRFPAGVGARLILWVIVIFVITLIVFVGLDIVHESRFAESLGATRSQRSALLWDTLALHTIHAAATALAFGLAIHFLVRGLITRRIARIVQAVRHFRHGTWSVRIPERGRDEIEWLTAVFRQLGPDLERQLSVFVEVDRKSVVARLGYQYEASVGPPTRQIIALARERNNSDPCDRGWPEVEQMAQRILVELEILGQPDHPGTSDIVTLDRGEAVVPMRKGVMS